MRHWGLVAIVLLLAITGRPTLLRAGTALIVQADDQFTLAERLYAQQKYVLARLEYERFIHFFPEDSRIAQARYRVGMAYYAQRQYAAAIQAFKPLVASEKLATQWHADAFLMSVESQLRLGRPALALTLLRNLEIQARDPVERDKAIYRSGWIYVDLEDWEGAVRAFGRLSSDGRERYRIAALIRQIEGVDQIDRLSPGLAGTLAIVPGGGYLYCRRYRDALISFLLNGVLIYAAYEAFDNELVALGSLITLVEIGFYSGNIYGAVSSAHKYNRDRRRTFREQLKKNLRINLSVRPQTKALEVALQYRFP